MASMTISIKNYYYYYHHNHDYYYFHFTNLYCL